MKSYEFGRRELLAMGTVMTLAPALRLFPTGATALAGKAVWLSAPLAIPPLLGYLWFLTVLMSKRNEGENLQELTLRLLGPGLGKAALVIMSLWFILYAGFVLRAGSNRFIVTVYPNINPAGFSVVMGLLALAGALGSARSLVRVARIVQPVVVGALLLVVFFALFSVKTENLFPITVDDALPAAEGSVAAIDIIVMGAYALCFIEGGTSKKPGRLKDFALWLILFVLLMTSLTVVIIGSFGAELTTMLSRPFFVLVRNLVFFRTVERVEALIVMLWIFPDFLLVSLFLYAGQYSLRLVLGYQSAYKGERLLDFSGGRYMIWLCAAAALLCAIFIAPDAISMDFWSQELIPGINLCFAFVFLPLVYAAAKIKKTI